MKKFRLFLVMIIAVLAISSCKVRSSEVDANKFKDDVSYFQCQKTGEVFAVVAIKTGINAQQDGVGLAHIDRADVTKAIVSEIERFKPFKEFDK